MNKVSLIIKEMEKHLSGEPTVWHSTPFKVLIATVLSQRTRDENTRKACKKLFLKYSTPKQIASASLKELEELIKESGFFRQKAKKIKRISKIVLKKFNGVVPRKREQLMSLPGVGRKTAECVRLYAYRIPCIPVDVHVLVVAKRLGLTNESEPKKVQEDLEKAIPKKHWRKINHLMVRFGQKVCTTGNPKCFSCNLKKQCKHYAETKQFN